MHVGDWRPFVYGGIASCVAEFGTFPIDTCKTRLQLQAGRSGRHRGMLHALADISRTEGLRALYAGIGPAVLRQATYGTGKFGSYYTLKRVLAVEGRDSPALNVACAAVAGAASSAAANPTDVLKVRMQAAGRARSLLACFREVYHNEGLAGLWRGAGPTAQRAAVIAAVELPVYDHCKLRLTPGLGDSPANHLLSSFIASLGSAVASTPIDVVRTRLMNQVKLKAARPSTEASLLLYRGSVDCLIKTVQGEGVLALYKGFIPTWVRMGPWNIIFFLTYEQLKKLY